MLRALKIIAICLLVTGCAGFNRQCSHTMATTFGADWLVVQYTYNGSEMACWKLRDRSVANEDKSDGIYWTTEDGHLIHISGWYNRIQISGGDFDGAARALRVDLSTCK